MNVSMAHSQRQIVIFGDVAQSQETLDDSLYNMSKLKGLGNLLLLNVLVVLAQLRRPRPGCPFWLHSMHNAHPFAFRHWKQGGPIKKHLELSMIIKQGI